MSKKIIPLILSLFLLLVPIVFPEAHLTVFSDYPVMQPSGPLAAVLAINPTSYDFGDMFIGDRSATTFEIWNAACCYLVYSITTNCTWITVSPTTGGSNGEHDIITVEIDTSSLDAGFHHGYIQITSNGGDAVFQVYVTTSIADTPKLAVYPTTYNFGDVIKGMIPSATFEVWNCGIDTLSYSISETYNWVLITPLSGTSTGEHDTITISILTSGLPSGPRTGILQITSNGGTRKFSFSINIKNPVPELAYSPHSINFGSKEKGETDTAVVKIWNSGIQVLTYTITESCDWISLDRTSGAVNEEPDLITITINTAYVTQRYNTYNISIHSNGGEGTITVIVYLGQVYTNITVADAYTLLTSTANGIQIPIDVRYDDEWVIAHLDTPAPENPRHHCACSLANDEAVLQAFITLYQGKEIILYCTDGVRSLAIANLLVEHFFNGTIDIMMGGIDAWILAGYPTRPNSPPNIPMITGETRGKIDRAYQYNVTTTDIDADDIYYYVNWTDNTTNQLIGPYHSGDQAILSHNWSEKGTYTVKVKARDIYGAESDYATLTVKMPKTSVTTVYQLLFRIFEKIYFFFIS